MFKISIKTLKEIHKCLKLATLNHRALTYEEKINNRIKIKKLEEKLEKEYSLIKEI